MNNLWIKWPKITIISYQYIFVTPLRSLWTCNSHFSHASLKSMGKRRVIITLRYWFRASLGNFRILDVQLWDNLERKTVTRLTWHSCFTKHDVIAHTSEFPERRFEKPRSPFGSFSAIQLSNRIERAVQRRRCNSKEWTWPSALNNYKCSAGVQRIFALHVRTTLSRTRAPSLEHEQPEFKW